MLRPPIDVPATAILVPLAVALLFAIPGVAMAQGFNCRYAHYTDEAAICQDPALGRLDDQLTATYNSVYRQLPPDAQRRLDRGEDAWVLERRRCGANSGCLSEAYRRRLAVLRGEIGAAETQPRNPPPGFPVPAPPFLPFGGFPVANAPGFPPPLPPGFRQPNESVEERDTQAPQSERQKSTETVEQRDNRAAPPERAVERTAEAPPQTTTIVTTEPGSAREQAATDETRPLSARKSAKRTRAGRSAKPTHEAVGESRTDQPAPPQPAPAEAAVPSPLKETHAAATPAPRATQPNSGSSQASGPSEPASGKPVIRWVDPPPAR